MDRGRFDAADLMVCAHAALRLYARMLHLYGHHLADEDCVITHHALTYLRAALR